MRAHIFHVRPVSPRARQGTTKGACVSVHSILHQGSEQAPSHPQRAHGSMQPIARDPAPSPTKEPLSALTTQTIADSLLTNSSSIATIEAGALLLSREESCQHPNSGLVKEALRRGKKPREREGEVGWRGTQDQ